MIQNYALLWEIVTKQFSVNAHSIHGPSHWKRVEQNGTLITKQSGANLEVVQLFALFHDCKRINDCTDPGHGARGAEYAKKLRGNYFDLSNSDFELLHYACTWHTDEDHTNDPTIGTCWDADRLDLGRVGVVPSPDLMNTNFGKQIAETGSIYSFLNSSAEE